ncbi:MAG: hypothetical protein ACFFA3_10670 [Promethearchaeota archaeon]
MAADQSLDQIKSNQKLRLLHQFIDVLEKFSEGYEKRLNFEKLAQFLKLSSSEADELLSLLLRFQDLFIHIMDGYMLEKKIINNQVYLIPEKNPTLSSIPRKLRMKKVDTNLLSDIIYLFKFVKKGKGFDVDTNGTDLLSNVKNLCNYYPFLFLRQNGVLYPSEFAQKLGALLLSYKKSNKTIDMLQLEDCEVRIE